jgi:uncharacterized phiE125 gp8 family phage protein
MPSIIYSQRGPYNQAPQLQVVTPPAAEPLDRATVKAHLRVDIDDDDALIDGLISASREVAESRTGRALMPQTLALYLDEFPPSLRSGSLERIQFADPIRLPRPPIQSVTSITYTDYTNTVNTMAPTDYQVDTTSEPGRIVPAFATSWPLNLLRSIGAVKVLYVCGYADAAHVPQSVKQGMLLLIGHWYETRETVATSGAVAKEIPLAATALFNRNRVMSW